MRTNIIPPDSPVWSETLSQVPHDIYHLPGYVAMGSEEQASSPLAFLAEEGDHRLLIPFLLRRLDPDLSTRPYCDVASPYGYPGPILHGEDDSDPETRARFLRDALAAFLEQMRQLGAVSGFFRLHPILNPNPSLLAEYGQLVHHGDTVAVDLTASTEHLWRDTRSSFRYDITRAARAGFVAAMSNDWERDLNTFLDIYYETMRRVNASSSYYFPPEYFTALRKALGNRLHLCLVRGDGETVCAGLFTECCGIVQYHLSGMRSDFARVAPSKLMLDYARTWAKQRSNRIFHLGGGVGGRTDSLFVFKSGLGKLRQPFFTWRVIIDPDAYHSLECAWQHRSGMSTEAAGEFFPIYRYPIVQSANGMTAS